MSLQGGRRNGPRGWKRLGGSDGEMKALEQVILLTSGLM